MLPVDCSGPSNLIILAERTSMTVRNRQRVQLLAILSCLFLSLRMYLKRGLIFLAFEAAGLSPSVWTSRGRPITATGHIFGFVS